MAEVTKHTHRAALAILRHNDRLFKNPGNPEIAKARSAQNIDLMPQPLRLTINGNQPQKITAADRYKKRLSQLYVYGRADVKTLCSWVISVPKDLPAAQEEQFFRECYKFLAARYGGNNIIQAVVHMDETTPHAHIAFIPVVENKKHGGLKVCANEVINRAELRVWHNELQQHMEAAGITARVITGITKKQGGNRTIKQLKQERGHERQTQIERAVEYER